MGFQHITDGDNMPEFGFFIPNDLIQKLVDNSAIREYSGKSSCNGGNKRPRNNIVKCDSLPKLDFSAWTDSYQSY